MTMTNSQSIFTWSFWKATIERVLFTFLECYFGVLLVSMTPLNPLTFDWITPFWPALGATVLSLVKCLLAGLRGNLGPSLANETLAVAPSVDRTT